MPLLRTFIYNNHLSKPDTKERLENHFKIFPHHPEETFGRFSKTIPCEVSKKKMIYGCLMCHRTFKSSRNCYHCRYKTPISYDPYFTPRVITCTCDRIHLMITILRKYKKHVATHDNFDLFQLSIQQNVQKRIEQKVRYFSE